MDASKEEQRLMRAMKRQTVGGFTAKKMVTQSEKEVHTTTPTKSPAPDSEPEWKRRRRQMEEEAAERARQELLELEKKQAELRQQYEAKVESIRQGVDDTVISGQSESESQTTVAANNDGLEACKGSVGVLEDKEQLERESERLERHLNKPSNDTEAIRAREERERRAKDAADKLERKLKENEILIKQREEDRRNSAQLAEKNIEEEHKKAAADFLSTMLANKKM